jgi:quinol monooxygenase YgiN
MEFVVIAQYRAQAGEAGRVEEALRKMVAPTRAEPGNLDYQVFRDPGDPLLFVLFERYAALADRVRLDLVPLAQ